MLVEVVTVAVAKIVVGDILGKHGIDAHQDLMHNRYGGRLVPTARLKTVELGTQIGALGSGCRISGPD